MKLTSVLTISLLVACTSLIVPGRANSQAQPFTIWAEFNAQSPQNTQDQWMADTLKKYKDKIGAPITYVSQPYDQIDAKLNLAVRSGGTIPDVSYVHSQHIGFFVQNGTTQ